ACGGFMLAERTAAHCELFAEDVEAAFFGSPDEMVQQVVHYLPRVAERRRIAAAGRERIVKGGNSYRDRLNEILALARPLSGRRSRPGSSSANAA
ncbi:MAG TPA: glycosyltransferase, partial [Candidatus Binataceae bacterium]|nr:glycosyltransferase [Candidatus Binataceae bacterium]